MPDGLTLTMTAVATRFTSDMRRFTQRVQTDGARVVRTQMTTTRQVIIATTPVDTTALQRDWGPVQERSTGTVIAYGVENSKDYGPVLEYGGYRGVGPRTVRVGGGDLGAGFTAGAGIYSTQAPLGFVRKALAGAWPQYRTRLQTMLRQAWPYEAGPGAAPLTGGDLGALFGIDLAGRAQAGGLSPGAQQAVRDIMGSLRSRRRRRT